MFSSPYMLVVHKENSLSQENSPIVRNNEESILNMREVNWSYVPDCK